MYVTEELRTYYDQITGVTNRNTRVLRLRNVKIFMSPTVGKWCVHVEMDLSWIDVA